MTRPQKEQRRSARFTRAMPVAVRTPDGVEHKCATRDISAGGVFFYCPAEFAPDSPLELVMILPAEITGGEKRWVCCHARVLRVEEDSAAGGQHGVAAQIERLEFLPEITA
jgi:PilZ domain